MYEVASKSGSERHDMTSVCTYIRSISGGLSAAYLVACPQHIPGGLSLAGHVIRLSFSRVGKPIHKHFRNEVAFDWFLASEPFFWRGMVPGHIRDATGWDFDDVPVPPPPSRPEPAAGDSALAAPPPVGGSGGLTPAVICYSIHTYVRTYNACLSVN